MKKYKSIFKETGEIVAIPKYKNKIVFVNSKDKLGENIYDKLYDYMNNVMNLSVDGGEYEAYDLGNKYLIAIIDLYSDEYKPKKTFYIKKADIDK